MKKIIKDLGWRAYSVIILFVVMNLFQVWADLHIPDLIARLVIKLQRNVDVKKDIYIIGFKIFLCALLSICTSIIMKYFASKLAASTVYEYREKIFKKVLHISKDNREKISIASLINRSTNDLTQIQNFFIVGLQVLIKTPILGVWIICKLHKFDWKWRLSSYTAIALIFILIIFMIALMLPNIKIIQNDTDKMNNIARENLNGMKIIRSFNGEKAYVDKFGEINSEYTKASIFNAQTYAILNPSIMFFTNLSALIVYLFGSLKINSISIADPSGMAERAAMFGNIIIFILYVAQLFAVLLMFMLIVLIVPKALISAKRVNEVIEMENEEDDDHKEYTVNDTNEEIISFKNVSFSYPGSEKDALKNINMSVKRGEKIAITGSTGSGKTSLINLLLKIYDHSSGEIDLYGNDINSFNLEDLRNRISVVCQKDAFFRGTVLENICLGKDAANVSKDKVYDIIETVCLTDTINGKENGVDSEVLQNGVNFSGGQKQRMSIARALYKNSDILVLDECTSALDYKTEKELLSKIYKTNKDQTVIIISKRISSLRFSDKIFVIDKGEIAACGTHEQLLENCDVYKQLLKSQL